MAIMSGRLVLPLISVGLNQHKSMSLAPGLRIEPLSSRVIEALQEDKELSSGFSRAVHAVTVGLVIEPSKLPDGDDKQLAMNVGIGQFVVRCLSLASEIPIEAPFWFDVTKAGYIHGRGRVTARVYGTGPRYTYPLDQGKQVAGVRAVKRHLLRLVGDYGSKIPKDCVGRALEFAFVGLQTWHVPTRLVNQVTFMEILFSTGSTELTFQIASRISSYLSPASDSVGREGLFDRLKKIYAARSAIVHGGGAHLGQAATRQLLVEAESVNASIFRRILVADHMDAFASGDRDAQLKKLGLGIRSAFR